MALTDFLAIPDASPLPGMAGIDTALANNAALGQQQAQNPHGLKFGSPIRNFLGAIGDALLVANGQQPLYHQRLQEQRQQGALQSYLGNVDPELAGLIAGGVDPSAAVSLYKVTHPSAAEPTPLQRNYEYLKSVDPKLADQYLHNQGEGSPLIASNGDGTFTIVPRSLVGQPQPQASGVPQSAIDYLKAHPDLAPQFDEKYGSGASSKILGGATAAPSRTFPLNKVMDALTAQESGGNGTAVSPKGALGSTQMLPDTARAMANKLGLAFRPDLLRSNDPKGLQYQRALAEAYFREGLDQTGNLRDALRYYHGGPNTAEWGPKTNAYADAVLSRLGAQ